MPDFDEERQASRRDGGAPLSRVPPHSIEAEESLIACCLLDGGDSISFARANRITAESFYDPAHRVIFEQLLKIADAGQPPDEPVLAEELRKKNLLDAVGGVVRINQITNRIPTTAHRAYFAEEIRTAQALRATIHTAVGAIEKAYQFQGSPTELASELNGVASTLMAVKETETYAKTVDRAIEVAMARAAGQVSAMDGQFSLGLPGFERLSGKPARGEMVICAALRSLGKSSLIGQGTLATCMKGHHVAVFNRETPTIDYLHRMAAIISKVNPRTLRTDFPANQEKFFDALKKLKELETLHIFREDKEYGAICARARQLADKVPLEAVVIDHIGLVLPPNLGKNANREREVSYMSAGFKNLAGDLNIPVIVISQLNRSSEKENNREPRLSDLRDSGSLENDADKVWFLYLPDKDMNGNAQIPSAGEPPRGIVHEVLTQAKDRNGCTFSVNLEFNRPLTLFREIAK